MPNSPESWKRVPSTRDALFGLELPYRPPKSPIAALLWRRRIWLETTFGLSVLEPWEKLLVCKSLMPVRRNCQSYRSSLIIPIVVVFYLLLSLVLMGFLKYLPLQLIRLEPRMLYCFLEEESQRSAVMLHHVMLGLFRSANSTSEI